MNPFEDLIRELGRYLGTDLKADAHQSCRLDFIDGVIIQIDLHSNADKLLLGAQLGRVTPGPYRLKVFLQALKMNALAKIPQGIFAFSEKNDTLVLFQFLPIVILTGEKLFQHVQVFHTQALQWFVAFERGEVPALVEEVSSQGSGFFGLKP